jgi:hypothetical protein
MKITEDIRAMAAEKPLEPIALEPRSQQFSAPAER